MDKNFKQWLRGNKNLSENTIRNYSNRLKNKIPEKMKEINFFDNKKSLYNSSIEELLSIKEMFDLNEHSLKDWNKSKKIGTEALSALNYLIEYRNNKNNQITQPLNQILYGPPGTGKTYNTINKALEILFEELSDDIKIILKKKNPNKEERKKLTDTFKKFKENGQIEFVTFHQSYGYEEFVEGIRADVKSSEIKYKLEKGIFQELSKKAELNYEDSKKSKSELQKELTLKDKIEMFLTSAIENNTIYSLTQKNNEFQIIDIDGETIIAERTDKTLKGVQVYLNLDELYEILKLDVQPKSGREVAKIFGRNNPSRNDTYYFNLIKPFQNFSSNHKDIVVSDKNAVTLKKYILIIDEINRGNISKIFGELITLIEPSKRIGENEELKLTLPNSKELFGVPKNLYIIGTMNTADRSIAQIDTALRRRFKFEEMMPKPELIVDENNKPIVIDEIEVQEVLKSINERIEQLYDREHTIGHSYFMPLIETPVKDRKDKLDEIFEVNIIPLLAEYFYGDWGDIMIILNNNGFIQEKEPKYPITSNRANKVYQVSNTLNVDAYKKIYEQ